MNVTEVQVRFYDQEITVRTNGDLMNRDRQALIYLCANTEPAEWRLRLHHYNEQGVDQFYGGRLVFEVDSTDQWQVLRHAIEWVKDGTYPGRTNPRAPRRQP